MKTFRCPARYRCDSSGAAELLKLLGPKKFLLVQEVFGGRRMWIPKKGSRLPCAACAERPACIRHWRKGGRTPAAIADHLGISQKSVYRILGARSQGRRK